MDKRTQKDTILEITQFDMASQRRERKENPCTPSQSLRRMRLLTPNQLLNLTQLLAQDTP